MRIKQTKFKDETVLSEFKVVKVKFIERKWNEKKVKNIHKYMYVIILKKKQQNYK